MIGDIILYLKKIIHQHFFCIHDYKPDRIGIITGLNHKRVCSKCDKFES
jgi:hypothetical protein